MVNFILAFIFAAVEPVMNDTEAWNQAVDFYRNGDITNAVTLLKPLTLSRTKDYAARSAELLAKLEFERGNQEEAAAAAQIALRKRPDDARVNRNYTRATDRLAEKREEKRIAAIIKAAQGKDPGTLLKAATDEARRLFVESGEYRTNAAERAVALSDRLSKRAEKLTDAWIPVKELIAQSVTNEEQATTIIQQLNAAEEKTKRAAKELGDLDGAAYTTMSEVEHDFTRFLKLTASPPTAIAEDIIAQSNAWQDVEVFNSRAWQPEALDWTRAFSRTFPAWAHAYEQQAQSDTNKPPFSAEDQQKVAALAMQLEKLQLECLEKSLPPDQEEALSIARQIQELLPKDQKGGGSGQSQSQNQQNDQQQQPDKSDQQDQPQNQDSQDQPEQSPQNQDEQPDQNEANGDEQAEENEAESPAEEKDIEALLQKAQERNDEHEAEKKARSRKAPLPPNERDW